STASKTWSSVRFRTGSRLFFWLQPLVRALVESGYCSGVVVDFSIRTPSTRASSGVSCSMNGLSTKVAFEEAQPVAVKDGGDVGGRVAAGLKKGGKFLQIGDGIELGGDLFGPEAAVEVGSDGDVIAVAGDLADVVNVVGDVVERDCFTRCD